MSLLLAILFVPTPFDKDGLPLAPLFTGLLAPLTEFRVGLGTFAAASEIRLGRDELAVFSTSFLILLACDEDTAPEASALRFAGAIDASAKGSILCSEAGLKIEVKRDAYMATLKTGSLSSLGTKDKLRNLTALIAGSRHQIVS